MKMSGSFVFSTNQFLPEVSFFAGICRSRFFEGRRCIRSAPDHGPSTGAGESLLAPHGYIATTSFAFNGDAWQSRKKERAIARRRGPPAVCLCSPVRHASRTPPGSLWPIEKTDHVLEKTQMSSGRRRRKSQRHLATSPVFARQVPTPAANGGARAAFCRGHLFGGIGQGKKTAEKERRKRLAA